MIFINVIFTDRKAMNRIEIDLNLSFEDMLSKFKQTSDEKLSGMKKTDGNRRTAQNRRKPQ